MEQRLIDANKLINNARAKTFGLRICDIDNAQTILAIPDNPTNGDMIKAMFPNIEMWGESKNTLNYSLGGMIHRVLKSWWNAPYKKGE